MKILFSNSDTNIKLLESILSIPNVTTSIFFENYYILAFQMRCMLVIKSGYIYIIDD